MANRVRAVRDVDDFGATFELDDGSTTYLTGPAAHDLAADYAHLSDEADQRVGPVAARADQRTADSAMSVDPRVDAFNDPAAVTSSAQPSAYDAQPVRMGTTELIDPLVDAAVHGPAQEAARRAGLVQTEAGRATMADEDAAQMIMRDRESRMRPAYSPGYDPLADAASRVPVPTTMSESREGVRPLYEDVATAREALLVSEVQTARERANAQMANAQNQAIAARAQRPALLREQADAQQFEAAVRSRADEDQTKLEEMTAELGNFRIDTQRYFRDKSAGATLAAVVGLMLVGLGGGDPVQLINTLIDRDVRAQEREYGIRREAADNALAQLRLRFGDTEQAKLALKMQQAKVADNYLAEMQAVQQGQDAQARYAQARQALSTQYLDWLTQFRDRAVGNATVSVSNAMKSPRAGGWSAPRVDPLEQAKRENEIINVYRERHGLPTLGAATAHDLEMEKFGAQREAARESKIDDVAFELQKAKAANQSGRETVEQLARRSGLERDENTGKWKKPSENYNIPQVGWGANTVRGTALGGWLNQGGAAGGRLTEQDLSVLVEEYGRARTGAVISPAEEKNFRAQLLGGGTEDEFVNGLNIAERAFLERDQALDAGVDPSVLSKIDSNRSQQKRGRAAEPELFDPNAGGWNQ